MFPICNDPTGQTEPCVIARDTSFYVFWSDLRNDVSVYGTRVSRSGVVDDTVGHYLAQGYALSDVRAAHDDQNLLVVFRYGC